MARQTWPPQPPRVLTGTVAGVNNSAYTAVSFPAGYFTQPPRVVAIGAPTTAVPTVYLDPGGPTTSGFGVAAAIAAPGIRVDWIAIQH